MQELQPIRVLQGEIVVSTPDEKLTMAGAAQEWIDTKRGLSGSEKTEKSYWGTYEKFRDFLQANGVALDDNPRNVARLAQRFVFLADDPGRKLSTGTVNQRLAALSSYYNYCVKHGACEINPINLCERPKRQIENAAPDLDADYVSLRLQEIDTRSLEGKRDYALISVALTTGRRAAELAGVEWQHIMIQGEKMRIKFVRCKGAKVMEDEIKKGTVKALLRYIRALYGPLEKIAPDAPIFLGLGNRKRYDKETGKLLGLSHQAIADIFEARLGVRQVHAARHTFAVNMSEAGASIEEIGDRLGHSNYKVTADYLKRRKAHQNKYGDLLEARFGI